MMEFEEEKIKVMRDYFLSEFPKCALDDLYNFDSCILKFKIKINKNTFYVVEISEEFIDDNDSLEIKEILRRWNLGGLIRKSEGKKVLVSGSGLKVIAS